MHYLPLTVEKLANLSTCPPMQPQTSTSLRSVESNLTRSRSSLELRGRKWQVAGRHTRYFQAFRARAKRANSLLAAISGCTKPHSSTQFYLLVSSCSLPIPLIWGRNTTLKLHRKMRDKSSLARIALQADKPSYLKIKVASSTDKRRKHTAKWRPSIWSFKKSALLHRKRGKTCKVPSLGLKSRLSY